MIDWSGSKTSELELWKNPLISYEDALQIADGAIAFRNEIIKNLRDKIEKLEKHHKDSEYDFDRWWDKHCEGEDYDSKFIARMAYGSSYPDWFTGYGQGVDASWDRIKELEDEIKKLKGEN